MQVDEEGVEPDDNPAYEFLDDDGEVKEGSDEEEQLYDKITGKPVSEYKRMLREQSVLSEFGNELELGHTSSGQGDKDDSTKGKYVAPEHGVGRVVERRTPQNTDATPKSVCMCNRLQLL